MEERDCFTLFLHISQKRSIRKKQAFFEWKVFTVCFPLIDFILFFAGFAVLSIL
jgi:hypothetical protein